MKKQPIIQFQRMFFNYLMISGLVLSFGGCFPGSGWPNGGNGADGGPAPGQSKTTCEELKSAVDSVLQLNYFWPPNDTYGVNTFYLWELDKIATDGGDQYYFHNGEPVTDWVPEHSWGIPPPLWSAIRLNLDGLDPHKFSETDPFYLGYLPYVPSSSGVSWQSKTNAKNDGTCPKNNYEIGGRPRCVGKNQLDPASPTLTRGKVYLTRMLMLVPLPDGNYTQSCWQKLMMP